MQCLSTIEVLTFDSYHSSVKVSVPVENGLLKSSNVFDAVVSVLGLKKESTQHFTLCEGLVYPKRRFVGDDGIPETVKELSFQKWVFSSKQEIDIMKSDDVAAHLIYMQARCLIETAPLELSNKDEEQLQEYSHPDFVLETPYTEICQRLTGYYQYNFYDCVVTQDITTDGVQFPKGVQVQLKINLSGLNVSHNAKSLHSDWTSVQSWQLVPDNEVIKYTVTADDKLNTVSIQTDRVLYMLAITKEMINQLQAADPSSPKFYSHMISKQEDGSTVWQNALFNYKTTAKTHK